MEAVGGSIIILTGLQRHLQEPLSIPLLDQLCSQQALMCVLDKGEMDKYKKTK